MVSGSLVKSRDCVFESLLYRLYILGAGCTGAGRLVQQNWDVKKKIRLFITPSISSLVLPEVRLLKTHKNFAN